MLGAALRAALREVTKLVDDGMSAEDFELTRTFLKKYSLHFAETTSARLGYAMDDRFYGIDGGYTAAFNSYVRETLGFKADREYVTIGGVNDWDWKLSGRDASGDSDYYFNVAPYLGKAMRENSGLKLFVAQGYYDFATPFFGAEYALSRPGFPAERIQFHYYGAGHMMYVRDEDLQQAFSQFLALFRVQQVATLPIDFSRFDSVAFAYRPAQQVGGDILDIVPLPERRALVFVGDAMGHGVEAALVMAAAKTALHTAVRSSADPADVLRQINDGLYAMVRGESFMTAVCARLDPAGGRAELALAGHPNPFHIDAATGEVSRPGDAGVPLGFRAGQVFPALSCPFGSGDKLVFFTDGVLEAKGVDGRHYGEERFPALVHDHADSGAEELLRAIERDLERHCQTISHDDLTVLAVQSAPEAIWQA